MTKLSDKKTGFTVIELLLVIVVIGILATLTIVAYNGIQQRATVASLTSDLDNASKLLKLYQVDNSGYPLTNDCSATPAANSICLKSSNGTTYTDFQINNAINPQTFCLTALSGSTSYRTTSDGLPVTGACPGAVLACPAGFIAVPGSPTYSTTDFCTMKFNAKNVGGLATSQASGTPWVNISQTTAISTSSAACTGCHLITEPEFLTIAQNVIGVASNWSGGTVGSGYIYSGHNDNVPANALDGDTNDANGYFGTGNSSPSNQRRTLTLSNGEVIWDLSGNVYEWTAGTSTTGQPGLVGESSYAWKQWNAVTVTGTLATNPFPVFGTPAASGWSSTQGIGRLYSRTNEPALHGFARGGSWSNASYAGIYTLSLAYDPSSIYAEFGFRVSK